MLARLAVAHPAVDDAMPTDQRHPAIGDQELAMVAFVEDADVADVPRMMHLERTARFPKAHGIASHLLAAIGIDQHAHLHARAMAFQQGVDQARAQHAFLPQEGLEMHGGFRLADVVEHDVEKGAVLQQLDRVAFVDGALRQSRQRGQEVGKGCIAIDFQARIAMPSDRPDDEAQHDDDDRQCEREPGGP
jgi:hypothetical protein